MQSLYFICNFLVTKYNSVSTLKCHTFTTFYYFTLQSLNIQPLVTYPKLNRRRRLPPYVERLQWEVKQGTGVVGERGRGGSK